MDIKASLKLILCLTLSIAAHHAQAVMQSRGMDSNGNQLFYDSQKNITWYDYSDGHGTSSYENELQWVSTLVVHVGSTQITNWRLPTSTAGASTYGYDGSTTAGFNITSSEMGNLYYISLGKIGAYDTSGNYRDPANWLNADYLPFKNIMPGMYFTSTPDLRQLDVPYFFYFYSGYQFAPNSPYGAYAIAVHDGDISSIPEPTHSVLFLAGFITLLVARNRRVTTQLPLKTAS